MSQTCKDLAKVNLIRWIQNKEKSSSQTNGRKSSADQFDWKFSMTSMLSNTICRKKTKKEII